MWDEMLYFLYILLDSEHHKLYILIILYKIYMLGFKPPKKLNSKKWYGFVFVLGINGFLNPTLKVFLINPSQTSFHSDLGFRVRADLTAGRTQILLLWVVCVHFSLTDYRETPSTHQGMLWCDKMPSAKWCFVSLPTLQLRLDFTTPRADGPAAVGPWSKRMIILQDKEQMSKKQTKKDMNNNNNNEALPGC